VNRECKGKRKPLITLDNPYEFLDVGS